MADTRAVRHTISLGLMLAGSALAAPAAFAQTAQPGQVSSVEEVVVTASKKAETIKNAPTAITALTSKKLDVLGINDFADYMPFVPSLQVADGGAPGSGVMILRGVYSGFEQTTATVGFYVDDVPFTPSSAGFPSTLVLPDPDLTDVDRIEVLKGPQGTLYGASTLGGLVRVITKEPDLTKFGVDLQASGVAVDHGGDGGGVKGSVNIPIIKDQLALRISGFDRFDPGFADNVQTGQNNVNTSHVDGGRVTLRYQPTDRLDIDANVFYQELHNKGAAGEDLNPTNDQPLEGRYKYAAFFNGENESKYYIYNLTGSYRFDAGTLTNAISYAQYRDAQTPDYTKLYGPLLGFSGVEAATGLLEPDMNKFTEDMHFQSKRIGAFELQAGVFYTNESDTYAAILNGVNGETGASLPPPFDNLITALSRSTYEEIAGYVDATWHFTDRLDATVGVRESYNDQSGRSVGTGLLSPSSVPELSHSSATDTSYLFNLRWRPTDNISTYLRAASAYRPGGPQFSPMAGVPASFGPDTVWNYEGGAKGSWFGGRLSADADVYYIRWTDIQLNALIDGLTVTGNGGNAHSEGFEFEGQVVPVDHLTIGANLAYDQTRIDSISANSTAGALVGDQLPNTPKWSGAVTADYAIPVSFGAVTLGATYKYHGSMPSSFTGVSTNTNVNIPAYSTLDLRARLDWSHYSLVFRVDNVTDTYALANIEKLQLIPGDPYDPVFETGVPIEPRTYRVSFEVHF